MGRDVPSQESIPRQRVHGNRTQRGGGVPGIRNGIREKNGKDKCQHRIPLVATLKGTLPVFARRRRDEASDVNSLKTLLLLFLLMWISLFLCPLKHFCSPMSPGHWEISIAPGNRKRERHTYYSHFRETNGSHR